RRDGVRSDTPGRPGDRVDDADPVLLAAHARRAGSDLRADRAAPVPRRPAGRLLAPVVEGSGGRGCRRRGAGGAAARRARLPDDAREAAAVIAKPSPALQARRAQHAKYKQDVQKRGKPFFPFAMFHDTVMSLVVVIVIIALACVWKWTTPGDHTGTGAGWLGSLYSDPADPGTTSFVPRPDWYFYFLFYLL